MKRILFAFFIFISFLARAQTPGEWVWLHGSNALNSPANFGIQGVPSPANVPMSFYTPCGWKDLNGNFWMFGGWNMSGVFGDLWKYDPLINEWTWMKGSGLPNDTGSFGIMGVASPSNNPPARCGAVSWTDSQGNFWMFSGNQGGDYCDLWKYDVSTNEWTWMKGPRQQWQLGVYGTRGIADPSNYPGSRQETAASWTDASDNLWLFGGYVYSPNSILFNDLWKYSTATNEWTWMKGSQVGNQSGVYGSPGIEDSASVPGGRCPYSHWIDTSGNLWLWGGWALSSGNFNDLWCYRPLTNNWVWMGGSNILNAPAVLGTKCIASTSNIAETAWENRAVWKDNDQNFWFFGAGTYVSSYNIYNQLWKYCFASGEWSWISGDATANPPGNWGTIGISSPTNIPSGRIGSVSWTGNNGSFYLFGGESHAGGTYNDLWMYTVDTTCAVCSSVLPSANIALNPVHLCPGTCTDFINTSTNATSYQWTFSGGNPSTSTNVNPTNICYSTPGNYDVQLIAYNANGSDTLFLANYITVYPSPPLQSITQSGDTLFAIAGATIYQWYYDGNIISGATDYFYIATASGDYNVVATDINGCEVEAAIFNVVAGLSPTLSKDVGVMVFPNPVEDKIIIHPDCYRELKVKRETALKISIYNMVDELVLATSLQTANCTLTTFSLDVSQLPSGMYYLEVSFSPPMGDGGPFRTKFIKSDSR